MRISEKDNNKEKNKRENMIKIRRERDKIKKKNWYVSHNIKFQVILSQKNMWK